MSTTVTVTNPGTYLKTQSCASICIGKNKQSIDECIANDEVWKEVQHQGRRGYLSRRFLKLVWHAGIKKI